MKNITKLLLILIFTSVLVFASSSEAVFRHIEQDLDAIIVKDLSKKKLIFAKDEDKILQPASLTKIMTATLAIESKKMDNIVTITPDMIDVEPTKANFRVGEQFYLRDLVHAALIKSANDAATAIAIYLGNGSKETFVNMMNNKADNLGMTNTSFTNPCGFDIEGHHSTAKDLLKLSEYSIKNKTFNSIVKLNRYSFKSVNTKRKYIVYSSNKLLRKDKFVVGIKTGFTNKAGPCLIARAQKNKKDILLVMLNSHNRWENAKRALQEAVKTEKKSKVADLFHS